jgi:hypothetical protein
MVFIIYLATTANRLKAAISLVTEITAACVTPELPLFFLGEKEFPSVSGTTSGGSDFTIP